MTGSGAFRILVFEIESRHEKSEKSTDALMILTVQYLERCARCIRTINSNDLARLIPTYSSSCRRDKSMVSKPQDNDQRLESLEPLNGVDQDHGLASTPSSSQVAGFGSEVFAKAVVLGLVQNVNNNTGDILGETPCLAIKSTMRALIFTSARRLRFGDSSN